jgi:uncharacterized membrane protein (DUF485 family)
VSTLSNQNPNTVPPPTPLEAKYLAVQRSPEFQQLRKRYRGWVIPVTVAALVWYLAYVLVAAYAPAFMAIKVVGNINVGLILGILQFITTFVVTGLYVRYAGRVLDPAAEKIRNAMKAEGLL